jgi:hypothetical protein
VRRVWLKYVNVCEVDQHEGIISFEQLYHYYRIYLCDVSLRINFPFVFFKGNTKVNSIALCTSPKYIMIFCPFVSLIA